MYILENDFLYRQSKKNNLSQKGVVPKGIPTADNYLQKLISTASGSNMNTSMENLFFNILLFIKLKNNINLLQLELQKITNMNYQMIL